MKIILLVLAATCIAFAYEFPLAPGEAEEIEKGLQQWREIAANQGNNSDEEYIQKLGRGLRKTSKPMPYRRGDREGTHALIRERLLSIPGHAEFFGKRVTDSYEAVKAGYTDGVNSKYVPWARYTSALSSELQVLALMPSPECVRVLGDMLSEDWKWPGYGEVYIDGVIYPLDHSALGALGKLPIANPPTSEIRHTGDVINGLESWKQWYAEVKSGRRTFRFIGDDTEYDLRGPVRRGGGMGSDRTAKRGSSESAQEQTKPGDDPSQSRLIPYLAGVVILVAGLVIYLRGRKSVA